MADPKIKYDIEASVSGSADVIALAKSVEKLAGTLDGDLKAKAIAAGEALRDLGAKQSAIDRFAELKLAGKQAAAGLVEAQTAAQALGRSLSGVEAPTRAQSGQLEKLKDSVRAAKAEVIAKTAAIQASRVALDQFGISTRYLADSQRAIKATVAATRQEINQLGSDSTSAANKVSASAAKQVASNKEVAKSYDGVAASLGTLKSQVAGLVGVNIGAGMVKDVLATADAFNNLQARIKISTGEGAAFTESFKEVSEIALRTGANLEQTGILFTKLVESGKSGGLTLEAAIGQSLRLTEIISQASLIGSSSAESSRAAINQLNQSLASGVLRGDEFNSVMEQAPRISKAMADGLGVTVGQLRAMAEAGALTSDVVIKALKNQADVIQKEFATLPLTVGRSVAKLQTQWALYIGDLDKGNGITAKVAKGLDLLANNLNGVINTVTTGVASYAGYVAVNKLLGDGATVAAAKVTTQAVASAEAAVATRAHGAAAGVAGAQVAGYGAAATAAGAQVAAGSAAGSAAAVGGFRAAAAGVAGFISKLGLIGVAAFAGYEAIKLVASGADQLLRKYSGLNAAEEKLAASEKVYTDAMKARVIEQEKENLLKQVAIDKTFGLTEASRKLITEFDEVVKKGGSAAEAIGKIGKDFDLSTVPGIQGARAVLDKLLSDGKITAQQFKAAFDGALTGIDLTAFNKNAKKVLNDTVAEARAAAKQLEYAIAQGFDKKAIKEFEVAATAALVLADKAAGVLQKNLDAGLRETVRRAGLDFELISTGMSKAAKSAIDDTNVMIKGLTALKAQGVDTGQALTASLGKSINTADSVKALEVVKSQIEQVRKALGDKVADGLLDQAKVKATELKDALEKVKPGIQSVREAMKELGVTSDQEFKDIAVKSKAAFDVMKESGTASARELQEAFKKVATDAIAANKGVAPEWVKTEAIIRKVTIAVDENGKATVESADKSKKAIEEVTRAYIPWGEAALRAADAAAAASEKVLSAKERVIAIQEKENALIERAIDLENKRLNIDRDKFSVDKDGKRIEQSVQTHESLFNLAKNRGVTDEQADSVAAQGLQSSRNNQYGITDFAAFHKAIDEMLRSNRALTANAKRAEEEKRSRDVNPTPASNPAPASTSSSGGARTINLQIGGSSYPVQTNAQGADNLIKALQIGARNAGY